MFNIIIIGTRTAHEVVFFLQLVVAKLGIIFGQRFDRGLAIERILEADSLAETVNDTPILFSTFS